MDGGRIRDKRESYGLSVKLMYFFAFYVVIIDVLAFYVFIYLLISYILTP